MSPSKESVSSSDSSPDGKGSSFFSQKISPTFASHVEIKHNLSNPKLEIIKEDKKDKHKRSQRYLAKSFKSKRGKSGTQAESF